MKKNNDMKKSDAVRVALYPALVFGILAIVGHAGLGIIIGSGMLCILSDMWCERYGKK